MAFGEGLRIRISKQVLNPTGGRNGSKLVDFSEGLRILNFTGGQPDSRPPQQLVDFLEGLRIHNFTGVQPDSRPPNLAVKL